MQNSVVYDCTPRSVHFAYKFTGKERDIEFGLDNFEALLRVKHGTVHVA